MDSNFHPDADPDYDFLFDTDLDADPEPTFHPDADPDPAYHLFDADADPGADSGYQNFAYSCGYGYGSVSTTQLTTKRDSGLSQTERQ